jgi:ADP-ribosyl-[dinitrogen reductase] hydrolase
MALCLGTSLVSRGGFDPADQMNRYLNWYRHGYLSSTGTCFDIGNTVREALHAYQESGDPFSGSTDPGSAGNGSLMRLCPVVMYFADEPERALHYARESSRTTHAAAECLEACSLFAQTLLRALAGEAKPEVLRPLEGGSASPRLARIADGAYLERGAETLRGSGYVVDTLESALWCFARASSFEEAILLAANLGDDADTTAAVCGQLAGAHHGESGIPSRWLARLALAGEIRELADRLVPDPALDRASDSMRRGEGER